MRSYGRGGGGKGATGNTEAAFLAQSTLTPEELDGILKVSQHPQAHPHNISYRENPFSFCACLPTPLVPTNRTHRAGCAPAEMPLCVNHSNLDIVHPSTPISAPHF